jgi:hypothetical protein
VTTIYKIKIQVVPKVDYQFQAVAREDKGPIVGIDWNKSPLTDFKTSVHNKEVNKIPDPIITNPTDASLTSSEGGSSSQGIIPTAAVVESHQEKEPTGSILPMSIEVLAIIIVCGVAVLLIFIGVVYKLFCGKRGDDIDEESCAEDDEHDEAEKERLDSTNSS